MITMAQKRALFVTAEGIETKEQLDHLRPGGCEAGQGYRVGILLGTPDAGTGSRAVRHSGICQRRSVKDRA